MIVCVDDDFQFIISGDYILQQHFGLLLHENRVFDGYHADSEVLVKLEVNKYRRHLFNDIMTKKIKRELFTYISTCIHNAQYTHNEQKFQ